jgi:uncharacterized protein YndB with AHSA1/START domain
MKTNNPVITVQTLVEAPIETVWARWTNPADIVKWNNASDDWHTTKAENDLKPGGKFLSRMEAKDGSFGFDFEGTYDKVINHQLIEYSIIGGRKVSITFTKEEGKTKVTESFEAENENSLELQRAGWQAILDNFKKYTES